MPPPVLPAPAGIQPFAQQGSGDGKPANRLTNTAPSASLRATGKPRPPPGDPPPTTTAPKQSPNTRSRKRKDVSNLPAPIVLQPPTIPKPAPPAGAPPQPAALSTAIPKPAPPPGEPPKALNKQNGLKPGSHRAVKKPRPPPGSPPPSSKSKENIAAGNVEKTELPRSLSQRLAAYRKKFLSQQKQLGVTQSQQHKVSAAQQEVKGSLQAAEARIENSSGVPGLDLDTPRASLLKAGNPKKRPRPAEEEIISLEDEIDLYSFGPSPASLAAASEGGPYMLCSGLICRAHKALYTIHVI